MGSIFVQPEGSAQQISYRQAQTLLQDVTYSGIGIHTGEKVVMRFVPAPVGTGIIFKRTDLPDQPCIPAVLNSVCDTSRNTTIGIGDVRIYTIEHVMAAIRAMQVDNLIVELSNMEPPVGNGSSDVFIDMIEEVGVVSQQEDVAIVKIQESIYWSEGDISIVALPFEGFKISYTLHYPKTPYLACQFFSSDITEEIFKKEIAPCRTFSLYDEVAALMDAGLIKGGSLDNAVVIKDDAVFSKGGLFFSDEMVRHKVLDMIGDLGLLGFDLHAHIIAIRGGHASNYAFAKEINRCVMMEKCS